MGNQAPPSGTLFLKQLCSWCEAVLRQRDDDAAYYLAEIAVGIELLSHNPTFRAYLDEQRRRTARGVLGDEAYHALVWLRAATRFAGQRAESPPSHSFAPPKPPASAGGSFIL